MKKIFVVLFAALTVFASAAEANKTKTDILPFDFAYRDSTSSAPAHNFIYLQGEARTNNQMIRACNVAGTNCVCEFYAGDGLVHTTTAADISFNQKGNYFRCDYLGATPINLITHVNLRNSGNRFTSGKLPLRTSLSLAEWLGNRYSFNFVRHISEYSCSQIYLQKQGTSRTSFSCASQAARCGEGNGDFCLLMAELSYFLYGDQQNNNMGEKASDKLYNSSTDSKVCGLQIFEYSCGGAAGLPQLQFGLYARQEGIWETAVQLSSRPGGFAYSYGFAANILSDGTCPMGLEKKIFYTATADLSRLHPSHNVPDQMQAVKISSPVSAPSSFSWAQFDGGDCNGNNCTLPTRYAGNVVQAPFVSEGQAFCVLPAVMLAQ